MPSKTKPITMDAVYTAPGYLFRRMQQIAVAIFVEECKAYDLTPVQYASLVAIRTHPGIDATRLSDLGLSVPADAADRGRDLRGRMQGLRPDAGAICIAGCDPHPSRHRRDAALRRDRLRPLDTRQRDRAAGGQGLCRTQARAGGQTGKTAAPDQARRGAIARYHAVGRSRPGADAAAVEAGGPQDVDGADDAARRSQQRGVAGAAAR